MTYRFDHIVDEFLGLVYLVFSISHNKAVKIFFLVARVSSIGAAFALLDGTLSTNGNFGT